MKKLAKYIEKHGFEIACSMMYISNNVNYDVIEAYRK